MHVTEVRSEQCKRISERYSALAARSRELHLADAETYASLAQQYAEDAYNLVNGLASPQVVVMAIACSEKADQ